MNILNVFILLLTSLRYHLCHVFTSSEDLKDVFVMEIILIRDLEIYLEEEKKKIDMIEKYLKAQNEHYQMEKVDLDHYISNPINCFLLIKRLTLDWKNIERAANTNSGEEFLLKISEYMPCSKFPREDDLVGISNAITYLQSMYNISANDAANGVLGGKRYNVTVDGSGCYEIGRQAFKKERYSLALAWMQEAITRLNACPDDFIDIKDVLEDASLAANFSGQVELARNYTKELLRISPSHGGALNNLREFTETRLILIPESEPPDLDKLTKEIIFEYSKSLCGPKEIPYPPIAWEFKCLYVNNGNPFLLIAPFKLEEIHLYPDIFLFHDVLSNKEIEMIKKKTINRLVESRVVFGNINEEVRSAKAALLGHYENDLLKTITKRIEDMTGLNLVRSEDFEVVNYGVGGFYKYHHDYFQPDFARMQQNGNRLATVVTYMSDIEQGGATVFPDLQVRVWPEKRAALFWRNLDAQGEGIQATLHASCPILVGCKWILNQWIRQVGQREQCDIYDQFSSSFPASDFVTVNME